MVAIIGLITALALPGISRYFRVSMNSITREMATLVRETYNATLVSGRIHRLVIDLDHSKYWIEGGSPGFLLHTKETLEKEEYRKKWTASKKGKAAPEFQIDTSITAKKRSLPGDLKFTEIKAQGTEQPITQGEASVHFFPNGFTEQAIIYIEDSSGNEVSLVISALVGKTYVFNRHVDEEEAYNVK